MEAIPCPTALGRRGLTWVRLARWICVAAVAFALGVASLLLARRLGGGAHQPLAPDVLWLLALFLVVGGLLLRPRSRLTFDQPVGLLWPYGAILSAVILSAAVSVPGSSRGALTGLWLAVLAQLAWLLWWTITSVRNMGNTTCDAGVAPALCRRDGRTTNAEVTLPTTPGGDAREMGAEGLGGNSPQGGSHERAASPLAAAAPESPGPFLHDVPFSCVEQQLIRASDPQAGVIIHGRLRATFEAGQRNTSLHVAFCPPLRQVPTVSVEPLAGPPVTAKIGVALLQGARVDVRLETATSHVTDVVLEFHAQEHLVSSPHN